MNLVALSESDDFHVHDPRQDCRGWPVMNAYGEQIGRVEDLLIDPSRDRVARLRLVGGETIPIETVALRDNVVEVRQAASQGTVPVKVKVVDGHILVGRRVV